MTFATARKLRREATRPEAAIYRREHALTFFRQISRQFTIFNPLYSAGTSGAGISIAIAGRSNINMGDVEAFRTIAGLPANAPEVTLAGVDPGLVANDQDEATLDVEWSGAVAPQAPVKLVAASSTATTDGVDLAAAYIVNHALAPVVSVSYGSCEQEMGAAGVL